MKQLFTLVLILISLSSAAQITLSSSDFVEFFQNIDHLKIIEGPKELAYKGSPYLFENEGLSTVILNDSVFIEDLSLRYNVYNDEMEIKKNGRYYVIPKEKLIPEMLLNEHRFSLKVYYVGQKKYTGYFENLGSDSKLGLYMKYDIFLQEAVKPKPFQDAIPPTFLSNPSKFYLSLNDSELVLINSKKDFLEYIPDHKDNLASFIKKNKIKFRKPNDVKELVEYYNSL